MGGGLGSGMWGEVDLSSGEAAEVLSVVVLVEQQQAVGSAVGVGRWEGSRESAASAASRTSGMEPKRCSVAATAEPPKGEESERGTGRYARAMCACVCTCGV